VALVTFWGERDGPGREIRVRIADEPARADSIRGCFEPE